MTRRSRVIGGNYGRQPMGHVVMLSAKSETTSLLNAEELGAKDYLIKPFDPSELLRVIERNIA